MCKQTARQEFIFHLRIRIIKRMNRMHFTQRNMSETLGVSNVYILQFNKKNGIDYWNSKRNRAIMNQWEKYHSPSFNKKKVITRIRNPFFPNQTIFVWDGVTYE